jgi:hypothetical protein
LLGGRRRGTDPESVICPRSDPVEVVHVGGPRIGARCLAQPPVASAARRSISSGDTSSM